MKTKDKSNNLKKSAKRIVTVGFRVFRLIWPFQKKLLIIAFALAILIAIVPFVTSGAQALLINELVKNVGRGFSGVIFLFLFVLTLRKV